MLFRKQNARIKRIQNIRPIIFLPLLLAVIIAVPACSAPKGGIVILENPYGTGFTMDFNKWSSKSKCELSLDRGDELQFEVILEGGRIALMLRGKNGSEPYMGNNVRSGVFTVTVAETDRYEIRIYGKYATGKVIVKNLGSITR